MDSPFHQLHSDEVVPVSRVEDDEAVWRRGLELEEQVHGGVGLQRGQTQVAALGLEGHRVSDDGADAEASVQLTVIDVSVLTQVNVEHAVKPEDATGGQQGHQSSYTYRLAFIWLSSMLTRLTQLPGAEPDLRLWRWPMKLDGMLDTNLRSVMVPVSMLWNSRRVWSPTIWPGDGEGGGEGLKKKTKNKKKREYCLTLRQEG